jgi:hypothetical protein
MEMDKVGKWLDGYLRKYLDPRTTQGVCMQLDPHRKLPDL